MCEAVYVKDGILVEAQLLLPFNVRHMLEQHLLAKI